MRAFYRQDISSSPENETSFVGRLFEKARKLPDTVPKAIRQELANLSAEINGGSEALKKVSKEEADKLTLALKEKAKNGLQKYAREWKTAELKNNKKFEKLLSHASSFDDVRAGDILRMRANGENIANFLLTNEEWNEINLTNTNSDSFKNTSLLINFGNNKSINASIGLGDILPYEVTKVEVTKPNGEKVTGELWYGNGKWRTRMGYYGENGKYIPIYNNYTIRILATGKLSEETKKTYDTISSDWSKKIRINEMITLRDQVGEKYKESFSDEEDQKLFEKVEEEAKNRESRRVRTHETYWVELWKERFIQLFWKYVNEICSKYNVPPELIIRLFQKESNFSYTAKAPSPNTGYGLGQINNDTWNRVTNNILPNEDLDREDPKDQILASIALLSYIKGSRNVKWPRAAVLYHTWEGLLNLPKSSIDNYLEQNALEIRNNFKGTKEMSDKEYAEAYAQAAESYYKFSDITAEGYTPLNIPTSTQFVLNGFISHPAEKINGMTYCSRSAFKNMREFGILSPEWNAKDIEKQYSQKARTLSEVYTTTDNVADIILDSNTENGSKFGHRAVAIKGKDNIWYVLDPYTGAKNPKPLDEYLKTYVLWNPNPRFYTYKSTNWLAKEILA